MGGRVVLLRIEMVEMRPTGLKYFTIRKSPKLCEISNPRQVLHNSRHYCKTRESTRAATAKHNRSKMVVCMLLLLLATCGVLGKDQGSSVDAGPLSEWSG